MNEGGYFSYYNQNLFSPYPPSSSVNLRGSEEDSITVEKQENLQEFGAERVLNNEGAEISSSDKFRERLFIPYHNTSCFIALLPIISRNLECY